MKTSLTAADCSLLIKQLIKIITKVTGDYFAEVTVGLVDGSEMRRLNKVYRKHDKVTDILSFTYEAKPIVGELVLCLDQADRQAIRRRHDLAKEVKILFIHALLHLAGYDHMKLSERKIMRGLENKILELSLRGVNKVSDKATLKKF